MTVLDVIQRGAHFLAGKGVDSPRLQVELLLAHVLQMPRLKLYLNFERELSDADVETLRAMVRRRGEREPLQHILGSTSFCGLEIGVNRNVLVPRPETEGLAERGWEFLNRRAEPVLALDFGTGSGCLAIAVAVKCPVAQLVALEQSEKALATAKTNAARHEVQERITFVHGADLQSLPPASRFDLIISNPPYIPTAEIETLQPEVRNYDPPAALDGGKDGLDFYRYLATHAGQFLAPNARMMLEFGDGQECALPHIFSSPWQLETIDKDYSGCPRFLILSHDAK